MSNNNDETKNKGKVERVLNQTVEARRELQHLELKKWDRGQLTPRQCIENILEIEKIIFFNNRKVPRG
jgi:hypothetical protein